MACYSPLHAYARIGGGPVVFNEGNPLAGSPLVLACGQCIGCRIKRSKDWAIRVVHEAQLYDQNSFITLTYNDQSVPFSLRYRDFQLFMRRLRKQMGKARFYMCGEYGSKTRRPHFHAILFGVFFHDRVPFKQNDNGDWIYTSKQLDKLWSLDSKTLGFASVGDVSFLSAAYIARYCMEKVTGDRADAHYAKLDLATGEIGTVEPEFNRMSLKPGIGSRWFLKYRGEVYPHDSVVINGSEFTPPRFYDRSLSVLDPDTMDFVNAERFVKSQACADDNTYDRLAVRARVTRARLAFNQRNVE